MCPGTPLGSQIFEIGKLEGQLAAGERLLILTDGIPEVSLANEQLLGPRGVANFYQQTREQELESALSQLISKVEEVQATSQDDDWTVVLVQWGTPLNVERSELVTTARDRP
jgi:serine phosphatase RsbU (regulator of sigma subunit)